MNGIEDLLRRSYAAFNRRDIEAVLAVMHTDVNWPNGMEGGRIIGHDGVRRYWTRQWSIIVTDAYSSRFGLLFSLVRITHTSLREYRLSRYACSSSINGRSSIRLAIFPSALSSIRVYLPDAALIRSSSIRRATPKTSPYLFRFLWSITALFYQLVQADLPLDCGVHGLLESTPAVHIPK
jgi:hypothetical protein